jgi:carboxyl-terminal processing protease
MKFRLALGVLLTASACADKVTTPSNPPPNPSPSDPAVVVSYLDELTRIMRTEAANAAGIDWDRFRAELAAAAADAQTISAAYPAIELALRLLGDFESHYVAATGRLIGPSPEPACTRSPVVLPPLPDTIGYVRVGGCPCEGAAANAYAEALQTAIQKADRPGLTGWIVDLREDGGGNMWPMIAGLGPILGEGIMGWIVYNNREYEREYRAGAAMSLGEPFASVEHPYVLEKSAPRVAVLTGGGTNSAGEAITVWFRGRPDTRSFGTATCGHHHLLASFRMSDGAQLTLKTAHNADRLKQPYAGPVAPDEIVSEPGEVARRALEWLQDGR